MNDARLTAFTDAIKPVPSIAQLGAISVEFLQESVQFDRFNIGLIDHDADTFKDAFVYGQNVNGRSLGNIRTLDGTVVEAAMNAGGMFAFAHPDLNVWLDRFPRFGPVYQSGMRKMIAIMLQNGAGRTDAALVLAAKSSVPYNATEMRLLQHVAATIAEKLVELRG